MQPDYIIVQAGGKGTRLMPLTTNRPKALVPVNNLPILFHLFRQFPDKKFIVIGDYRFDILERYLRAFADVRYILIKAKGEGNAAGVKEALSYIPDGQDFLLIWSDLLLPDNFDVKPLEEGCYIGVTDRFPCSWRYHNGCLEKVSTSQEGVAGIFLFDKKNRLTNIPEAGSFTKYLSSSGVPLRVFNTGDVQEAGNIETVRKIDTNENRCRPYNRITVADETVIKEGLTPEANKLIHREIEWYKIADTLGFKGIPRIYAHEPLTMERIHGDNVFRVQLNETAKETVLSRIYEKLEQLHHLQIGKLNCHDMQEEYYLKTLRRLQSIRDVIPFADEEFITINGMKCCNVYRHPELLQEKVNKIIHEGEFGVIHGDCTLTNTLIDTQYNIYYIDARGYFGHTALIGDVYYDWAKVYYSINGAFDQFNVKNFSLTIGEDSVSFHIAPSGWEFLTPCFLQMIPHCDEYRLKLIHAIIWLSLASHCWEDYDSLCTAFYNGLYLLNALGGDSK